MWSHPGRVRSEAAFAALAGTCPIPASSGNTLRHRLNRGQHRASRTKTYMRFRLIRLTTFANETHVLALFPAHRPVIFTAD
nr:transposase [Mycobacterium paragordonae]